MSIDLFVPLTDEMLEARPSLQFAELAPYRPELRYRHLSTTSGPSTDSTGDNESKPDETR